MDTEDELANILGHEVEHVDLGHCIERVLGRLSSPIQETLADPNGDQCQHSGKAEVDHGVRRRVEGNMKTQLAHSPCIRTATQN